LDEAEQAVELGKDRDDLNHPDASIHFAADRDHYDGAGNARSAYFVESRQSPMNFEPL
jgi:hypothetical protein